MESKLQMIRYAERFGIAIIILHFFVGIVFYPAMPDPMASHWNADGNVDGFMPRFWGVFLLPAIAISMFLIFHYIPIIDPLKKNIKKFRLLYDQFFIMMFVFFFYLYTLTLLWNLGVLFDMGRLILPAVSILFYYIANLLDNAEQNWFIGIRTPWTLSSKKVWHETHKLGASLFRVLTFIALAGMFSPFLSIYFIIVPVVAVAVFLIGYSYYIFKK